ncbi:HAD family hydrolase [Paenibacillus humicola]|uniref:HAD family hydrolase n=1 Tax=Paenibacillus humicola TaxID=3110540 RepID=UPI00237B9AEB|nr:HAD family hydrolase [Paenibacillus humicola]
MSGCGTIKGILFDMDNTLLQSSIDYPSMKRGVYEYFRERGAMDGDFPVEAHTTATVLEHVRLAGGDAELLDGALEVAAQYELAGMEGAGLEPGARELLKALRGRCILVIVTNNAYAAAVRALKSTGILDRFDLIVGREQMTAMKPAPSGYLYAMERFGLISSGEWLSVGDAWIDGKASAEAGVRFVSYRTPVADMLQRGVKPVGRIGHLLELADWVG